MSAEENRFSGDRRKMRIWQKKSTSTLIELIGVTAVVFVMFQMFQHRNFDRYETTEVSQVNNETVEESKKRTLVARQQLKDEQHSKPNTKTVEKHKKDKEELTNIHFHTLPQKTFPDVGVNKFFKLNIPKPKLNSSGYLLPMLFFEMGPNNLYRHFRQGAVTAYEMGRSVVVPVFHRHPRMGDEAENPFVLPIYDQNYTVDLVWSPNETIDISALMNVLGVISLKDFRKNCNGRLDALVQCGEVNERLHKGFQHFQRAVNLKIDKEIKIESYEKLVPNDLSSGVIGPDVYKCLGIMYGKKCLPDKDRWLATFSRISKSFRRPLLCRKFATSFIEDVMGGQPYMAVHWRYDVDWLDMCKPTRPTVAQKRNREICRLIIGLMYEGDTQHNFIQAIKDKMAEHNLEHVFLASPPNNDDLIRLMDENFAGSFHYSDDLTQYAKKTKDPNFVENNYMRSLIEQEICYKSTLFLGSSISSWTQTVLTDRLAQGIMRYDSILHVVGKGKPSFPALQFQFPEGRPAKRKPKKI